MAASSQFEHGVQTKIVRSPRSQREITFQNILFATDFEAPARRALPFAVALAARYGAKLYASHVVPRNAFEHASADSLERVLRETEDFASFCLDEIAVPLRQRGLHCDPIVGIGNIPSVINESIRKLGADLLVIGTSSRTGWDKLLLGSVTEELIREALCPVLTVGPHITTLASCGVRCIVCATDYSPPSTRAVEYAVSLAEEYGAQLSLLHVLETRPSNISHLAVQIAERHLREALPGGAALALEPEFVVETGVVSDRVVNLAVDLSADLIVMGAHGAGALAETASRLGSTAHRVVSLAPCPVLTIRGDKESQAM